MPTIPKLPQTFYTTNDMAPSDPLFVLKEGVEKHKAARGFTNYSFDMLQQVRPVTSEDHVKVLRAAAEPPASL